MNASIQYGSINIGYYLEYSERKSLGITVQSDMTVVVKAPLNSSVKTIQEKLKKKAPWIIKQQNYFLNFHPKTPARKYVSGESHLYLGRTI